MRKTGSVILISLGLLLVHSTLMKLFVFGPFRADLFLFALVYVSLREGSFVGVCMGFFIGLLQDVYMPSVLGVNAFSKALIGYLVGFLNERQWKTDIWIRSSILFIMFFLHDALIYMLHHDGSTGLGRSLFFTTLPAALYTLILWILFEIILKKKEINT
jgi:rod shape-determining protein MreD